MRRRTALKTLGLAAGSTLVGRDLVHGKTPAAPSVEDSGNQMAILVDTTKCLGCRMCERACATANDLPEPPANVEPGVERTTSTTQWTVVNRYETEKGPVNVKRSCMHCLQPACASACLTRAMSKTSQGPVTWDGDKCMGCRFCMLSCPFDVPKFEYDSPNPRIQKCQMCWSRLEEGQVPACVEACPAKAIVFGRRDELLELAKERIYTEPDKYVHHVYGEHEVGGTSVLYLASVPFEQIGFRTDLGSESYPTLTKEFLYSVPIVDIALPVFLLGLAKATKGRLEAEGEVDR
jgi:Fe-S-cluster-containing dehydrogenase component